MNDVYFLSLVSDNIMKKWTKENIKSESRNNLYIKNVDILQIDLGKCE